MYGKVEEQSDADSQSKDSESLLSDDGTISPQKGTRRKAQIQHLIIGSLAAFASLALGFWIGSRLPQNLDRICVMHTSKYSPILDDIPTTYTPQRFNGSLLRTNTYREKGGHPDVDAAWSQLGTDYRSLSVPAGAAAQRSGLQADQVHIRAEYGGGYPANVEGLHHLHCLNLVRQALYYNAEHYRSRGAGAWVNSEDIVQQHVAHCLDIVRQRLMCTVDTGLLGQVWVYPAAPQAFPDFNTVHMCKDFEAVRRWAELRQLPQTVPGDFLVPPAEGDRIYEEIP